MDTRNPYETPSTPLADPVRRPGRFTRSEKVLLAVLLVNAAMEFLFMTFALLGGGVREPLLLLLALRLPILGIIAAGLMFRLPVTGLALGAVFYFVQSFAFFSPRGSWALRSEFNASISVPHRGTAFWQ